MYQEQNAQAMAVREESDQLAVAMRKELLHLAALEDARAADEAASAHYWEPMPVTVIGHRAAAGALRAEAERIADLTSLPVAS